MIKAATYGKGRAALLSRIVRALHWTNDYPVNGVWSESIETYLQHNLTAYAAAWPGSKAVELYCITGNRIVRA